MLATCVNMLYSLARFLRFRPSPPFTIGGVYIFQNNRHHLRDAEQVMELRGEDSVFTSLQTGDFVTLEVVTVHEDFLECQKSRRLRPVTPALDWPPNKPHAARFAEFLATVREYFRSRGCRELHTPYLVPCPGLEPALEPFSTELRLGRARHRVYLPTSPEIHLKKAMTRGWTDIFEIKTCFRNDESTIQHQCEFSMLEWYRAFADLELILDDLQGLLVTLQEQGWIAKDRSVQLKVTDFATLFREILNFPLKPTTTAEELRELCVKNDIHTDAQDTLTDLFHRLLIEKIEPPLAEEGAVVVRRFPPELAALAKLDEAGWADRMEFYWNGLEIANGFNEVTDPKEQFQRWQWEQSERQRLGRSFVPMDETLLQALEQGLPPSGGIALGLERLYMAAQNVKDIRELRLFPVEDLFFV